MIELNLLPDVKKEFLRAQKLRNTVISVSVIAVIAALGVAAAFALFVYVGQTFRINQLTSDITTQSAQLNKITDLSKYLTMQNQLANINNLHDEKTVYSRLFDYLVVLNPKAPNNTQFSNVRIDSTTKKINFRGSTNTFESFNVFKDTLLKAELSYVAGSDDTAAPTTVALFDTVEVRSSTLAKNRDKVQVSYEVEAVFNENAFLQKSRNAVVNVPKQETTNSAVQSPQPLFNEQASQEEEQN